MRLRNMPGLFSLEVEGGKSTALRFVKAVSIEELEKLVEKLMYANAPLADVTPVVTLVRARAHVQMVGGSLMRVANTHSMEPAITAEDLLILKPALVGELEVGDIIVFKRRRSGGMMIGHRVIETKRTWVETKGDNLRKKDTDLITQDMLLGRVEILVDEQTGEIRDMRVSHEGELISLETLERRFGTELALVQ